MNKIQKIINDIRTIHDIVLTDSNVKEEFICLSGSTHPFLVVDSKEAIVAYQSLLNEIYKDEKISENYTKNQVESIFNECILTNISNKNIGDKQSNKNIGDKQMNYPAASRRGIRIKKE